MAYEISWYEQGRVIFQRMYGSVTLHELRQITEEVIGYVHSGTPLVHLVVDMTRMEEFPFDLSQISATLREDLSPMLGWTIIISKNSLVVTMSRLILQLKRVRFRVVTSREEAFAFLAEKDTTLRLNTTA